jgi:hypothetical protein
MPSYDTSHFDPPAPVAHVTLRNPQSGATVSDVLLRVDTGADITLLPHTAVERLGVPLLADQQEEIEKNQIDEELQVFGTDRWRGKMASGVRKKSLACWRFGCI